MRLALDTNRIAALAIQHDLPLFARDSHFDHISQLVRI